MKNHLLFKPGLAAIGLLLTAPARVHGQASFNPVSLTPASYTYGIVVPSNTVQAVPYCINALCGSGQCLTCDNTFYEQGMYARPGQMGYNSGIPRHDTILTNINNTNMTFLMPPDYTTNNDLMIVKNTTAGYGSITSGTFLFGTPTTATNLAFLCTDGNGAMSVAYTVTHSDGSTDSGSIAMLDWFTGGATVAWGANGRMDENGDFNNYDPSAANNNVPYLYANKITVSGASPISRVAFRYSTGTSVANFFAVSGNASGAEWTPIPVSGFNIKSIIPAAVPFPVTATMDNGTNVNEPGNTWFEEGYYQLTPSDGLPPSGSTFTSVSQPTHTYQMGDYASNNAVLIDVNHLSASMTPSTPAAYSGLALLTTGANIGAGEMDNLCILQHQDGVKETNLFFAYDWFNTSVSNAVAWNASGRVNLNNRTLNDLGDGTPKLFESYFAVSDSNSPVTNIVVQYRFGARGQLDHVHHGCQRRERPNRAPDFSRRPAGHTNLVSEPDGDLLRSGQWHASHDQLVAGGKQWSVCAIDGWNGRQWLCHLRLKHDHSDHQRVDVGRRHQLRVRGLQCGGQRHQRAGAADYEFRDSQCADHRLTGAGRIGFDADRLYESAESDQLLLGSR